MIILKRLIIGTLASALIGCSVVAKSNDPSADKVTSDIRKEWHFFHKDRNYRFRFQSLTKDANWNARMLKALQTHGYGQSTAKFNTPQQLLVLVRKTNLEDVKLIRKVGVSSIKAYQLPVIYYEINSKSPYGTGRYKWARMINIENLNKISDCLNPAPRFQEGWAPTFQKETPIIRGQCFRPRE